LSVENEDGVSGEVSRASEECRDKTGFTKSMYHSI